LVRHRIAVPKYMGCLREEFLRAKEFEAFVQVRAFAANFLLVQVRAISAFRERCSAEHMFGSRSAVTDTFWRPPTNGVCWRVALHQCLCPASESTCQPGGLPKVTTPTPHHPFATRSRRTELPGAIHARYSMLPEPRSTAHRVGWASARTGRSGLSGRDMAVPEPSIAGHGAVLAGVCRAARRAARCASMSSI
jgi:hypothetical protein